MNKIQKTLTLLMALSFLFLTSCENKKTEDKEVLNVFNWGEYIDEELIKEFEKETNIKVNYSTFLTNEEMYTKVKNKADSYDLLMPSDYMIEKMIQEDMLEEINFGNVPNFKNVSAELLKKGFDMDNKYSVPYFWGTLGILYNTKEVTENVDSWKILFDEKYKGKILMYDSERDSFMPALSLLGYDINTNKESEVKEAIEMLKKQKDLVLAYVIDDGTDKMISGEAAISLCWSGEAIVCMNENPDLKYIIPKELSNIWFDSMVIPKTSQNKEAAEKFINFFSKPSIAKRNSEAVGYASPIKEVMDSLSEEELQNPAVRPKKEDYDRLVVFRHDDKAMELKVNAWLKLKED